MTCDGELVYFNADFVSEYVNRLDPALTSNPKFLDVLNKELKYVRYKTNSENFSIYTSFDKKGLTIMSTEPVIDCVIKELSGKNKAFINIYIHLNGEDLYDEYSQGVLFDRKQMEAQGINALVSYESKFETSYFINCYNKEGIEYSNSSFSDSYPIAKKSEEFDLQEQTLSSFHKPIFYEKSLPKAPIHILKAKARNTYRKRDSIAIIHTNLATMTPKGYEDVLCSLHCVHPLFLDMLRGSSLIAKSVEQDGRFIFVPENNYASSIEDGYKRAKKETKRSLKEAKENLNPISYEYIINNI